MSKGKQKMTPEQAQEALLDLRPEPGTDVTMLTEQIKGLIAAGADVNAESDFLGETPRVRAAHEGYTEVIEALIAAGADVNANAGTWTPLITAARYGHVDALKILINAGARVNEPNTLAPLPLAARHGHTDVIEALIAAGVDMNLRNNNGETSHTVLHVMGM